MARVLKGSHSMVHITFSCAFFWPGMDSVPSSRHRLSCDDFLVILGNDDQNSFVLGCVLQLCTVVGTILWAKLDLLV